MTNTIERTIRNEAPINVILGSTNKLSFFQSKPNKKNITWGAVFNQQIEKATWEYLNNKAYPSLINATFNVISLDSYTGNIPKSPIYVLIGIKDEYKDKIAHITHLANAVVVFESDKHIQSLERYGEYVPYETKNENFNIFIDDILKNNRKKHRDTYTIVHDMWGRKSSDDLLFMLFVLIDVFSDISVKSVQTVTNTDQTGLSELSCMCSNCAQEMIDCFSDPTCRKALDCLNKCKGNDQVIYDIYIYAFMSLVLLSYICH